MAAISGTLIAKAALTALSNEKQRKGIAWTIGLILSPVILIIVLICGLLSGTADHNNTAVGLCFDGGVISGNVPEDYRGYIEDSNPSSPVKNDCSAVVPRYKPFRQGIGIGKIKHRAFRYIYLRKVDIHYLIMLYSVIAKKSIESATKRFRYFIRYVPPLASIDQRMKIPIFLMT